MASNREIIRSNWNTVQQRACAAAEGSGRDPQSVKIVGVTKYVDAETTRLVFDAGCHDLGESRPQVLWQKADALDLSSEGRWHLIGHLQTNKVRRVLKHSPLIHSVDSKRLLAAIAAEAVKQERLVDVLLEVNISGDENKTGLDPVALQSLLSDAPFDHIRIRGLMAMAGLGTDHDSAFEQFQAVTRLRDQLQDDSGISLPELSMGMSADFEPAIAAGATLIRVGSILFEGCTL